MSEITSAEIWLIVGLISLAIEFMKLPGIGFLFLGLGGFINSILVHNYSFFAKYHYISFGLISFICFLVFWWPLKKYIYKNNLVPSYFDIVGSEVEVYANPISSGASGQVKWSGTIMNAKLEATGLSAEVGDKLIITEVEGNVLICRKNLI